MTRGRQGKWKKVAGSSSVVPPAIYESFGDPLFDSLDDMTLPPSPTSQIHSASIDASRDPDSRVSSAPDFQKIFIRPRAVNKFDKQSQCIKKIGDLIEMRFEGPWKSWSKFPKDTRDLIFSEFGKYFEWDPTMERTIRSIFDTCAMTVIKNRMYVLRQTKKKPEWLGQAVFDQLHQIWLEDDFRKESERNKKNRASDCDGQGFPLHVGGCVSHSEHIDRMVAKQEHEPTIAEAFMHLRSKTDFEGNVQLVNDRAKRTHEEFTSKLSQLSSQNSNEDEIISTEEQIKIFSEVVGGPRKGVIYGLAGQNYNVTNVSSSSSRSRAPMEWEVERTQMLDRMNNMQSSIHELQSSFETRVEAAVEQRVEAAVSQRLQEEARLMQEKMNSMEARLLASFASFHQNTRDSS